MTKSFCPSLKTVRINYAIAFCVISVLGIVLLWFDLAGSNAYDLVAKTSEFSLSVAELETSYQRADLIAREMIVSATKSESKLEESRANVWFRLGEVQKNIYEDNQAEMIDKLKAGLIVKFENQNKLILAAIGSVAEPQTLRNQNVQDSISVSEMFIALKLEEARGITARAADADKHRRRFRVSTLLIFLLLYGIWIISYFLTIQAITARIYAADYIRQKYEKTKTENGNFVGVKLYAEVIEFLEQKNA